MKKALIAMLVSAVVFGTISTPTFAENENTRMKLQLPEDAAELQIVVDEEAMLQAEDGTEEPGVDEGDVKDPFGDASVASVNGIEYSSLQEAVTAAAQTNEKVTLLCDTTEKITVTAGQLTLDLNGNTLSCNDFGKDNDFIGAINVTGGDLTIIDSSEAKSGAVKSAMFTILMKGGNLTIEDGTYGPTDDATDYWEPLFVGKGYATVKGGTFLGDVEYFAYYGDGIGGLTIEGGKFALLPIGMTPNKGASILIYGSDSFLHAYSTYADFASENSEAFVYNESDNVLQMVGEYSVSTLGVWINQDVTWDLNGQSFILKSTALIVNNQGVTLNICDSGTTGMIKSNFNTAIDTLGTLNLLSGKIESGSSCAVLLHEGGTFNMTGGELVGSTYGVTETLYPVNPDQTSTIVITGGKITAAGNCVHIRAKDRQTTDWQGYVYYPFTTNCTIGGTAVLESTSGAAVYMACGELSDSTITIDGGTFNSPITKAAKAPEGSIAIRSGSFKNDVSDFMVSESKGVWENGFYQVFEVNIDSAVRVEFRQDEADTTGRTYNIVLVPDKESVLINRLNAVDLTFANVSETVAYRVESVSDIIAVNEVSENRYDFHFITKDEINDADCGHEIIIGQVIFGGYGKVGFSVAAVDTNAVQTTAMHNNIVTTYIVGGGVEETVGELIINDAENGGIINTEFKTPTKKLTVNIAFPNAVVDNAAVYQDMKLIVSGGDLAAAKEITLGSDNTAVTFENGAYTVVIADELTENTAYTVTVSGAGYRTARYTVTMTEDKVLNFWNNVMDAPQVVETGKESSAVTKNFLAGDIVKDNNINIYDLSAVVSYFGTDNLISDHPEYAKYDLNRDGKIDSKDVAMVLVSWGE